MPRASFSGKSKSSAKSGSLFAPETEIVEKKSRGASGPLLIAHIDGGARGNPGPAGFGVHIQEATGKPVAELSEFLGHRTNNYAEYSGLIAALEYAVATQHRALKVVSDSELMVKQIRGEYKVKSPELKVLYDNARRLIRQLDTFEIGHVLRNKNKDADRLANEAMDRGMKKPSGRPAPVPTPSSASARSGAATADSEKARAQFSRVAEGYVTSPVHAEGQDLVRIAAIAKGGPHDTALDIATGGGHTAMALARIARSVIATDVTLEMLAAAEKHLRSKGISNVEFRPADAHALPFDDASFDVVTCRIAAHHFPQPLKFAREVRRVLRSGGTFLLEDSVVPGGEAGEFMNRVETIRDHSHVRSMSVDQWWQLLAQAGFRVTGIETFCKRHELEEWLGRMQTSEEIQAAVRQQFASANEHVTRAFGVEVKDGEPVAYSDLKALFTCV
jgi:ribonuclease HI